MAQPEHVADVTVSLEWTGEAMIFRGGLVGTAEAPKITLDSTGAAGPSPPTTLLLALAGCMAVDVLDIAQKMRVPIGGLRVVIEGDRRPDPPRRFIALRLRFIATGASADDRSKLERAIDLSREKYCSVLHTLREDIDMTFELLLD